MGLITEGDEPKKDTMILNFPLKWWETIGMKLTGNIFVDGVFGSVKSALDWSNRNSDDFEKPLKTLVVGSHGQKCSSKLFLTADGDSLDEDIDLLVNLRKNGFIGSDTQIFFTSCYGADYLIKLAFASLASGGNEVIGSEGVYNWFNNSSEGGFYSCKFGKTEREIKDGEGPDSYKQWYLDNISKDGEIEYRNLEVLNRYYLDMGFCKRRNSPPHKFIDI